MKWYRLAVEQGDANAEQNLAMMFYLGRGVPQDDNEAARRYRHAADQGYANAQYNLGRMFFRGRGVPQDNVKSYFWLSLAITVTGESASKLRDEVANSLSPEQIAEVQKLAREWKPKKAE